MRDRRGRHLVRRFVLLADRVAVSVDVARRDRVGCSDVAHSGRVGVGWIVGHRLVVPSGARRQPVRKRSWDHGGF
jgi:hypothetical protein